MAYLRSQMVYKDYAWTARADHDNPKFIGAQESAMLNRGEGYEMLWFINSLGKTWNWANDPTNSYQQLERIIKTEVPSSIRTHTAIKDWIAAKYTSI